MAPPSHHIQDLERIAKTELAANGVELPADLHLKKEINESVCDFGPFAPKSPLLVSAVTKANTK